MNLQDVFASNLESVLTTEQNVGQNHQLLGHLRDFKTKKPQEKIDGFSTRRDQSAPEPSFPQETTG